MEITRRKLLAAVGGIAAAAGTTDVFAKNRRTDDKSMAMPRNHGPYNFEKVSARELIRRHHLPNVELVTQDGKKVRFYDDLIKNRKFVLNFIFTNCENVCPIITANLVQVQKLLRNRVGHDIFFYSITLDPERDTPKVLKAYANAHKAGPGWLFLAGKPADTLLLRKSLGYTYDDPAEDADIENHIGMLLIGDEPLMRWGHCEGQAHVKFTASNILNEADNPFKGCVNGVRQIDPTVHI